MTQMLVNCTMSSSLHIRYWNLTFSMAQLTQMLWNCTMKVPFTFLTRISSFAITQFFFCHGWQSESVYLIQKHWQKISCVSKGHVTKRNFSANKGKSLWKAECLLLLLQTFHLFPWYPVGMRDFPEISISRVVGTSLGDSPLPKHYTILLLQSQDLSCSLLKDLWQSSALILLKIAW
jgi:hypothetical protein